MHILHSNPLADSIEFTNTDLIVHLKDARVLSVPLLWFPKLAKATRKQLEDYELLGDGEGIHWTELDEDLSVYGLLSGIALKVA
jgi:hypothetical protein